MFNKKNFGLDEIVFASTNQHKANEVIKMLEGYSVKMYLMNEFSAESPEETGLTFVENALIKAKSIARQTKKVCLAEDSGLCIDALEGFPGIYSARFASKLGGYDLAIKKIEQLLQNKKSNTASFVSSVAICSAEPSYTTKVFTGAVKGHIIFPPSGNDGFAYDVIFKPLGYDKTFASMEQSVKTKISHRRVAMQKFIDEYSINE